MKSNSQRKCIVVLGMHRSGTSALSRVLNLLGVELGHQMLPAAEDNPKGFWENQKILEIHEELLNALGSSYDDVHTLPESWWLRDEIVGFKERLKKAVQQEFGSSTLFGIKDARISVLCPLWLNVFKEMSVEPHFIVVARHPAEVAASLFKRNGYSFEKSYLLWLQHILDAELWSRPHTRTFVAYDDLLANWRTTVESIGKSLSVSWPVSPDKITKEVESFLDPSLRHHRVRNEKLPALVESAYANLISRVKNPKYAIVEAFDQINTELKRSYDLLRPLVQLKKDNSSDIFHFAQLFVDTGSGYSEDQSIKMELTGKEEKVEFDISNFRNIKNLRLDPINDLAVLRIRNIGILAEGFTTHWGIQYKTNALYSFENIHVFENNDPQIEIQTEFISKARKLIVNLVFTAIGDRANQYVVRRKNEQLATQWTEIERLERLSVAIDKILREKDALVIEAQTKIAKLEEARASYEKGITIRDQSIRDLYELRGQEQKEYERKNNDLAATNKMLEQTISAQQADLKTITGRLEELDRWKKSLEIQIALKEDRLIHAERYIESLSEIEKRLETKIMHKDVQIAEQVSAIAERDSQIGELNTNLSASRFQVEELTHQRHHFWQEALQKGQILEEKERLIGELNATVSEKDRQFREKDEELVYVKNTFSYSVGRILTLPFSLLLDLFAKSLRLLLDSGIGTALFPRGSKRRIMVEAVVNFRQSIATTTYQLRHHGLSGVFKAASVSLNGGTISGNQIPRPSANQSFNLNSIKLIEDKDLQLNIKPGVSIVIPVLNESENLMKLLPVLNTQKGVKNIEVIVVDSGSKDDTVELAKAYGAKVIEIPLAEFSHSHSRNLGARKASEKYLLLMTADALPPSDTWLYGMVTSLEEYGVSAVSCMELPRGDADLFTRVQQWYHYQYFLEVTSGDKVRSMPTVTDPVTMRKHAQLSDVACLMPRDIYRKYEFRFEYGEDLDMGIRLLRDGHKIAVLSSTAVIHSHTRPPYYHLKRGYMDKLVLSRMLNESLSAIPVTYKGLLGDAALGFHILSSLTPKDLLEGKPVMSIPQAEQLIQQRFASLRKSQVPSNLFKGSNPFVDQQFKSFLEKICQQQTKESKSIKSEGVLLNELLNATQLMFQYMKETYEQADEHVLEDVFSCLYKSYANRMGALFAICYANSGKGDRRLSAIHEELGDQKILWDEDKGVAA